MQPGRITIHKRWLLWAYVIVPITQVVFVLDLFIFEQRLQPYLTTALVTLPLYVFFFELPHIITGLLSFADREYLRYYRGHLLKDLPLMFGVYVVLAWYSLIAFALVFMIHTMYHVVRQQAGLTRMLTREGTLLHEVWTLLGITVGAIGYIIIGGQLIFTQLQLESFVPLLILIASVFTLVSGYYIMRAPEGIARHYVAAASIALVFSILFLLADYYFLSLIIMRFVHDVTAILIYVTHDHNRNVSVPHPNSIYQGLAFLRVPTLVLTPLIGFALAAVCSFFLGGFSGNFTLFALLSVVHYSLERTIWKRGTIHRQQLAFS